MAGYLCEITLADAELADNEHGVRSIRLGHSFEKDLINRLRRMEHSATLTQHSFCSLQAMQPRNSA